MLLLSLAFSALISGYDAYINACSSQGEEKKICKCQADFLALKLPDNILLELTVSASNAMQGKTDRIKELARKNPEAIVALEKLEKEAIACGEEFD